MLLILTAIAVGLAAASYAYLARERLGVQGAPLLVSRAVGLAALILLLFNPTSSDRHSGGPPTVLLDASLSMAAVGGAWEAALDTALTRTRNDGVILRFGESVDLFDSTRPAAGASRVGVALRSVAGSGAPVVVVTDGELVDARSLPAGLIRGVEFVVLPRERVADAAIQSLSIPQRTAIDDSVYIDMNISVSGPLTARSGEVHVSVGDREVLRSEIDLPVEPGAVRRRVILPPGNLAQGFNVVDVGIDVEGDEEPADNVRRRVIEATEQPAIVILVSPADWEGRFLTTEIASVASTSVRGFAQIDADSWIDMRSHETLRTGRVMALAAGASLVFVRAADLPQVAAPTWHWPVGAGDSVETFEGDWYVEGSEGASPLAGRLAGLRWDSLPPLTSLLPLEPSGTDWTALTARLGRRGTARPVILGEIGSVRRLTTAGSGMWRWAFRGGAGREVYRAVLAAGIDWLLESDRPDTRALEVTPAVQRGQPLLFTWSGDSLPAEAEVTLSSDSVSTSRPLRFDSDGIARVMMDPGVYTWDAGMLGSGTVVVEDYSDEFRSMTPYSPSADAASGYLVIERYLRDRIWLFGLVVLAFALEWAFRQRKGLP